MSVHHGKQLERLIKESGFKKGNLAIELGMTRQNLHKMYNREKFSKLHIEKLCEIFGVSPDYFQSDAPPDSLREPDTAYETMSIKECRLKLRAATNEINLLNKLLLDKDKLIEEKERHIQLLESKR